jgi:hypothetical protein
VEPYAFLQASYIVRCHPHSAGTIPHLTIDDIRALACDCGQEAMALVAWLLPPLHHPVTGVTRGAKGNGRFPVAAGNRLSNVHPAALWSCSPHDRHRARLTDLSLRFPPPRLTACRQGFRPRRRSGQRRPQMLVHVQRSCSFSTRRGMPAPVGAPTRCGQAGVHRQADERSGPDVSSAAEPSPRLGRTGLPLAILPKYGLQINAIW